MRQEYIEVFLEIVRTRNVTKAASNLHLSQSAVSHYLKIMEEKLGVQLVSRHKGHRNVELTCHGEEFVPLAENWMSLLHQTEELKKNPSLEVVVGAVDSLNANILYPVCQKMIASQDSLHMRICTNQSVQLYELAEKREIDIGFVSYEANVPGVNVTPAFGQKMCVLRNRAGNSGKQIGHPSELPAELEIMLNWGRFYQEWHDRWWSKSIHPHVITDSILLLRRFLRTPGCWAVVPIIELSNLSDPNIEVCELLDKAPPDRILYQLEPRYIRPSRREALRLFKSELTKLIDANPALFLL